MKYEDFDKVDHLNRVASRLQAAYTSLLCVEEAYSSVDSKQAAQDTGISSGYGLVISRFSDGSGDWVNLAGCYVGGEAIIALQGVVAAKFLTVREKLEELGVDVSTLSLVE